MCLCLSEEICNLWPDIHVSIISGLNTYLSLRNFNVVLVISVLWLLWLLSWFVGCKGYLLKAKNIFHATAIILPVHDVVEAKFKVTHSKFHEFFEGSCGKRWWLGFILVVERSGANFYYLFQWNIGKQALNVKWAHEWHLIVVQSCLLHFLCELKRVFYTTNWELPVYRFKYSFQVACNWPLKGVDSTQDRSERNVKFVDLW